MSVTVFAEAVPELLPLELPLPLEPLPLVPVLPLPPEPVLPVELLLPVEVLPAVVPLLVDEPAVAELVLPVVATAVDPDSSSPLQAASASVAVPNNTIQARRPGAIACVIFCMHPPEGWLHLVRGDALQCLCQVF